MSANRDKLIKVLRTNLESEIGADVLFVCIDRKELKASRTVLRGQWKWLDNKEGFDAKVSSQPVVSDKPTEFLRVVFDHEHDREDTVKSILLYFYGQDYTDDIKDNDTFRTIHRHMDVYEIACRYLSGGLQEYAAGEFAKLIGTVVKTNKSHFWDIARRVFNEQLFYPIHVGLREPFVDAIAAHYHEFPDSVNLHQMLQNKDDTKIATMLPERMYKVFSEGKAGFPGQVIMGDVCNYRCPYSNCGKKWAVAGNGARTQEGTCPSCGKAIEAGRCERILP